MQPRLPRRRHSTEAMKSWYSAEEAVGGGGAVAPKLVTPGSRSDEAQRRPSFAGKLVSPVLEKVEAPRRRAIRKRRCFRFPDGSRFPEEDGARRGRDGGCATLVVLAPLPQAPRALSRRRASARWRRRLFLSFRRRLRSLRSRRRRCLRVINASSSSSLRSLPSASSRPLPKSGSRGHATTKAAVLSSRSSSPKTSGARTSPRRGSTSGLCGVAGERIGERAALERRHVAQSRHVVLSGAVPLSARWFGWELLTS